ncbi:sugar ABC transporter ATP-binding protein [Propionispora vibrioides]|uniref:Monosaccharide ABC transporter ATP-binding protein, CUT2 family n=1 Tax=Propionispora vibrioides TaxID=112903 RepID=A0A1H8PKZ8_9FIRM|nr:sugar ABC transporter ATP-binding protein [Propionispora vibrioides]SEO42622.1 monosaccharide ABC transporter ATP-binding protein, CUT2 family [Propionispora vibrioides]
MHEAKPLLTMRGIGKTFPGVKALAGVDFTLNAGEIHALMGENGAGKSTLIKVLTGVESLDAGEIMLGGSRILARNPLHAQQLGISTVYQEVNLCPNLSVAENIFIGREPMKFGRIDWDTVRERAELLLAKLNLSIDVIQTLDRYSVAIQQMVAIARALDISAQVLILDEPTSSLDAQEVAKLFEVMRNLKKTGMGIIFVTHFLDQVYEITDRITVLRNGQLVGEFETEALPRVQLVAKMIGKEFDTLGQVAPKAANEARQDAFVKVRQRGCKGKIHPFDLDVHSGEVLGLAGLLGSGRTETARVLFGIDRADSGELYIDNIPVTLASSRDAVQYGFGFCPEDRKQEGIIDALTVRENMILALQAKRGWHRYLTRQQQEQIVDKYIKLLNISTPGSQQLIKNLSGGNQQKVLLARWLLTEPRLLILDEPTRGIDVGTKTEIQKLIVKLAGEGMAVLFISSELDEMLRCCHRMAVFRDRLKIAELAGDELTESMVMQTIAGVQSYG